MSRAIWDNCLTAIKQSGLDYVQKAWEFTSDEDVTEFAATASTSGTMTVIDTLNGGACKLLMDATTDDSYVAMVGDASYLTLGLGRKLLFWSKILVSDATQSDWFAGVFKADTDLVGGFTDGVCFRKDDGDTNIDAVVHGASAESVLAAPATAAAADVYQDLLFYVEMDEVTAAKGSVRFYKDGVYLGTINTTALPLVSVLMTCELAHQTGDNSGTKYLCADFIRLAFTL